MTVEKKQIPIRYTVHEDQAVFAEINALGEDRGAVRRRLDVLLHMGLLHEAALRAGVVRSDLGRGQAVVASDERAKEGALASAESSSQAAEFRQDYSQTPKSKIRVVFAS